MAGRRQTGQPRRQLLGSAADAHDLMAPFNAFSRGWGERSGRITKDEEIDGLGDEAWLLRTEKGSGSGTEVTYHWRRANSLSTHTLTASGFAQATSRLPHVPGSTRSTRPREQARSHAQQRRGLDTQMRERALRCASVLSPDSCSYLGASATIRSVLPTVLPN
jgi:hypothetical protein